MAAVTVMLAAPEFVTVSLLLWLVPICTLPNVTVLEETLSCPACVVCEDLPELNPWQPTKDATAARTRTTFQRLCLKEGIC